MNLSINFLSVAKMATDDYVGFTFFVGCMAMMAASVFFFLSMNSFDKKWRTSILVSGLITFIAAVHYWYMRDYWASNMDSPTFFRYVDWILTVPLMCVEFYLILKVAGAKKSMMWRLIFLSVVMLVTGYFGEAVDRDNAQALGSYLWCSLLFYRLRYLVRICKKISCRSWWSSFKSTQNIMLVRTSWLGNLSFRIYGWN